MRYIEKVTIFPYKVASEKRPGMKEQRFTLDVGIHTFLVTSYKEFMKCVQVAAETGGITPYARTMALQFFEAAQQVTSNLTETDTILDDIYLTAFESEEQKNVFRRYNEKDRQSLYNPKFWEACRTALAEIPVIEMS